jgi:mannose/cellobiose epimerase-like protein (N-acyl-D-glucosamine 2-epimerase family)
MSAPVPNDFYSKSFLVEHIQSILAFYQPVVMDQSGGYFHNFKDDGTVFNSGFKQLVSSTRIIVNYARSASLLGNEEYKARALHGLNYLEQVHWQEKQQKRKAVEMLLDKNALKAQLIENKREQKASDEFAMQQFIRKTPR